MVSLSIDNKILILCAHVSLLRTALVVQTLVLHGCVCDNPDNLVPPGLGGTVGERVWIGSVALMIEVAGVCEPSDREDTLHPHGRRGWEVSHAHTRVTWKVHYKLVSSSARLDVPVWVPKSVRAGTLPGFYTKGRPLVKSNLICPSDKLSWQPGCPILNINIQGNFCISQGNGSSDNLPENLV